MWFFSQLSWRLLWEFLIKVFLVSVFVTDRTILLNLAPLQHLSYPQGHYMHNDDNDEVLPYLSCWILYHFINQGFHFIFIFNSILVHKIQYESKLWPITDCLGYLSIVQVGNVVYEPFVKMLNYFCDWNSNHVWDKVKVTLVYLKMKIPTGIICLFYSLSVKI